jgi:hypothetical protein
MTATVYCMARLRGTTTEYASAFSRHGLPELFKAHALSNEKGAGNAG